VGLKELPSVGEGPLVLGDLEKPVPVLEWEKLREAVLSRSSEVQEAHALAVQAEGALRRAEAEPIPNLFVNAQPYYSFIDREKRLQLQMYVPLPIYSKNQGNILAARAEVARTRAAVGQVELRLSERLAGAYQRYQAARRQVESYRGRIIP